MKRKSLHLPIWVKVLVVLYLKGTLDMTTMSKKIDAFYSNICTVNKILHTIGLVSFEYIGRLKCVSLTDKGRALAKELNNVFTFNTEMDKEYEQLRAKVYELN